VFTVALQERESKGRELVVMKRGDAGVHGAHGIEEGQDAVKRRKLATEVEEGEVLEEGEVMDDEDGQVAFQFGSLFQRRASKAWELDLKKPPKDRLGRDPLLRACSVEKKIEGMWLEFGVFSGETINKMALCAPKGRVVYGFDTFQGLPETWRGMFQQGHFDCKGELPRVETNVKLIKGLFQDVLEDFLSEQSTQEDQKIAVAHLDADLYSATAYVLKTLAPRIVPGTLLVFDELINYSEFREHEWKALLESTEKFGWTFEWIAQSGALIEPVEHEIAENQQVALRITSIGQDFTKS